MTRVAKALIFDPDGYALVLRRSGTHPYFAYEADLPGGVIEKGETFETGLARELREEIGLSIEERGMALVGSRSGLSTKKLYEIQLTDRPPIKISWEHDRYTWVSPQDLPMALASHDPFMELTRDFVSASV